jgi:Pyruvate/2-oxoacid:ferredoxin oxidoreductase gamma subunit
MVNIPSIALLTKFFDGLELKHIKQAIIEDFGEKKAPLNYKVAEIALENIDIRPGKKGGDA